MFDEEAMAVMRQPSSRTCKMKIVSASFCRCDPDLALINICHRSDRTVIQHKIRAAQRDLRD